MDKETLINLIPPTITLVFTSMVGLLVGVLIEKFKNRYRTITYNIVTQKVKPSLSENLGGQLKIHLGDREINTLKIATVTVENKSSVDFENLSISFTLGKDSWFQSNEGFLEENFSWLYWTDKFNEEYQQVVKEYNALKPDKNGIKTTSDELQRKINYALSNRIYSIPVFNRKESAVFNFLIEDPIDGSEADIFPSIIHKSVNFKEEIEDESKDSRDLWMGIGIGVVFVSIVVYGIIQFYPQQQSLIIWSAVIGFSYSIFGYGILYGFRKIRSFFD